MEELRSCPFCGSSNIIIMDWIDGNPSGMTIQVAKIECCDCGIESPEQYGEKRKDLVAAIWNKRVGER